MLQDLTWILAHEHTTIYDQILILYNKICWNKIIRDKKKYNFLSGSPTIVVFISSVIIKFSIYKKLTLPYILLKIEELFITRNHENKVEWISLPFKDSVQFYPLWFINLLRQFFKFFADSHCRYFSFFVCQMLLF